MQMSIGQYLGTRFSTLKPPNNRPLNPFTSLRQLNGRQWNLAMVAFFGWSVDALDFFCVSLTVTALAKSLNRSKADITWGITLVLMLRSVGAIIFGLLGDRYGRKWPFIINLLLFTCLEIGLGFVQTYSQFLAVRALFGIAMGGLYGNAAATALEDAPERVRGILSGLLQQGYAFGYLMTVVFWRAFETTPQTWRSLYWFTAGPPVLIAVWRMFLPETETYQEMKYARLHGDSQESLARQFRRQGALAIKEYWLMFIYLVLLMSGFNFMSHGSQDLYPTLLTTSLGQSLNASTVTNVVANLGALAGGVVMGYVSDILGRRLTIMICCVLGGAVIYPWAFVRNNGIIAGAFFEQFFVQGAWGVIPIHLSELAPELFRSFVVGVSYQLGNLVSSASSTIEATIGQRFPLPGKPAGQYDYSKVMAIFMGCVYAYVLIVIFLGPERKGRSMYEDETDLFHDKSKTAHDGTARHYA